MAYKFQKVLNGLCYILTSAQYMKYWLWLVVCHCFSLYNNLTWLVNGVAMNKRWMMNGEKKVHVLKVLSRFKLQEFFSTHYYLNRSTCDEFIYKHHSFEFENYLLKPNVTLYDINKDFAMFVETRNFVDVTNCRSKTGLMRVEQFRQAIYIIFMPYKNFIDFAKKLKQPSAKLLLLPNTGRSGASVVAKVLQATNKCLVFNEPEVFAIFDKYIDANDYINLMLILKCVILVLCKRRRDVRIQMKYFVIKPLCGQTPLMLYINDLFPNSKYLFIYRNIIPATASFYRYIFSLPQAKLILENVVLNHKYRLRRLFPGINELQWKNIEPQTIIQLLSLLWIQSYSQYKQFHDYIEDIDLVAVRYEDILDHGEVALRKILSHCDLEYEDECLEVLMFWDPIASLSILVDVRYVELIRDMQETCLLNNLDKIPENCRLPNTLCIE